MTISHKLGDDCIDAGCVNIFKSNINRYLARASHKPNASLSSHRRERPAVGGNLVQSVDNVYAYCLVLIDFV